MNMSEQDKIRAKGSVFPGAPKVGNRSPKPQKEEEKEVVYSIPEDINKQVSDAEEAVMDRCLVLGEEHLTQLTTENMLDTDVVAYVKVYVMKKENLGDKEKALNIARQQKPYIVIGHQDDMPIIFAKFLKDALGDNHE